MEKQAYEMMIEILARMESKLDEVKERTERIEDRLTKRNTSDTSEVVSNE